VKVIHFHRRPFADTFSIETLFTSIRTAMAEQGVTPEPRQAPHFSKGVWPRIQNVLWARRNQGEVNHITGDVHYLTNGLDPNRTILTIHDLFLLVRLRGARRQLFKKLWFDLPVRQSRFVTVISEATKRELLQHVSVKREKLIVIPNIIGPQYTPTPRDFNEECPVILHVGTRANKNLARLITAIEGLRCRLQIVGALTPELRIQLNKHRIDFVSSCNLTDQQMCEVYRGCDLVSFVSLYEGFGMPIIEGQAIERPVVTSNCSSMPEVAGAGALLVDPYDVGSIRRGVERVLIDRALREELVEAGRENRRRFEPATVAKQYIDLYDQIAPGVAQKEMTIGELPLTSTA
jgi:glycosyltransferase involved in cell wall biosynthesis